MSYVSISKTVRDRIVQAACETRTEIIGFLLGRFEEDTIVIEGSTTHEFSSEPHRVMMPAGSIAVIADKLVSGRLKGNIVGWYHSHTAGGLFFSDTDIVTQKRLQQFSSLVTGIVVDASNGDVGYFRVTPGTNNAIRLPEADIRVFIDPDDAIQRQPARAPSITATPTVEVRRRQPMARAPSLQVVLALTFVVLIVSIGVLAGVLYSYRNPPIPQTVTIILVPVSVATVGTPIQISANVTGNGRNVTLVYGETVAGPPNVEAPMKAVAADEYVYNIPGSNVTGNIAYYVKAYDSAGKAFNTTTYQIAVADFNLQSQTKAFTVYRTRSELLNLQLISINNFDKQLRLSATGNPDGLTISYSANPATPGAAVSLNFTAGANIPNGTYHVTISAAYTPPQNAQVTRQDVVDVTVADFQAAISAAVTVNPGATASFTISLTLQKGFVDPVSVAQISGFPPDSTYGWVTNNPTILAGGPGTTSVTLQFKIPASAKAGTYMIEIVLTGGGIIHTLTTQIIVR